MDYDELQRQVGNFESKIKESRKEHYHYARSKGFSSREAMFLASKSKDDIDRLAKERDNGKVDNA